MKKPSVLFLSAAILTLVGCTHSLEIKNLSQYQTTSFNKLSNDLSIGIMTSNTNSDGKMLVSGTAEALSGNFGKVLFPYKMGNAENVDIISKIAVRSDHKGSGYNFFINFPGFLVWAPAWHGYIYEPSYNIDINMIKAVDNSTIDSFTIPIKLDVRHASINRTWTELSWLEVGVIALVGGVVFTNYDDEVTPLVDAAIQKPIGDFIAQEMADRLRNSSKYKELVQQREAQN